MTTTDIFRKIYQDLKEEVTKENNNVFLKEYTIPSINYQENNNGVSDLYFTSGIEIELDRMMNFFENKVSYRSYKDKYFFSNNEEKLRKIIVKETNKKLDKEIKRTKRKNNNNKKFDRF